MSAIILDKVSFGYADREILQDLSLTFPEGSVWCLMGASGRGKTTLLRLLLGLEKPQKGEIIGLPERRAAVFQEDRLLADFSAVSNVRFACPGVSRETIQRALTELGLGDSLHKSVRELSGGMKRRVALARCLLSDAQLLVLDEPFKGLDEQTRQQAYAWVLANRQGRTLIAATHDPADVQALGAQRILL